MNQILEERRARFASLLKQHGLTHALILGAGRDKLTTWFLGKEAAAEGPPDRGSTPTLPPFNRNNIYVVPAEGEIIRASSLTPHPTDAAQYPVLEPAHYPEVFGRPRLGIVNPECLKKVLRDKLLAVQPELELVDLTEELRGLKAEKSEAETAGVQAAARVYDRAFAAMRLLLREGRTEHDAAVELRWRLSQLGANDQDLQTLSVVTLTSAPDGGFAAAEPLLYPGRRLQLGDRINVSCTGFLPGGFAAALGRCYVMGNASDEAKRYWSLAVQAQDLAARLAVPGATIRAIVERVNRELLEPAGLPADGSAWLYGIGCDRCEAPRNTDRTGEMPLKAGMTLVIGPNIRPDGKDPYRCVDVFAVAEDGAKRLSQTPRELVELF